MRLEDDYEIVKKLGQGGFGQVFLVQHKGTGQRYAAKVLTDWSNPDAFRRFEREVRQLLRYGQLRHVVRLVASGLRAERPYFIMPYAPGGAATPWAGKLSELQVRTIMRQLMEALTAMHASGGFHRDVKPDNLLLVDETNAALADFGLGNCPTCTVHFTATEAGTFGYAAPELLAGGGFSFAADVFSAGATWFHLLTGAHPGKRPLPLDPRTVRTNVPPSIAKWIVAMTAPDPWKRPRASQVAHALGDSLRGFAVKLPNREPTSGWELLGGVALVAALLFGISRLE